MPINSIKSCPSCRQGLLIKNNIKPCRIIERLVNSLKVKCPLQLQQNSNNNNSNICEWNGELSDLDKHVNITLGTKRSCSHPWYKHISLTRSVPPLHQGRYWLRRLLNL